MAALSVQGRKEGILPRMKKWDIAVIPSDGIGKKAVPVANINVNGKYPSMFEPVHGSAPDIYGKGIANPIGQI
ncbi:tartrate dehydrogenase [Geobacillus thermoleovorans]|nr:tartrate dehydrogenase [Geobacillus thermoleovorans]AOL36038.1 tartrate dehydrogenase [Geobacillus thermoleovorans]